MKLNVVHYFKYKKYIIKIVIVYMAYSKIENCHISDLVNYLRDNGYTKEYPSKKTCIEELRRRGVYQIDVKSTRIIKNKPQSSRKLSNHSTINNISQTTRTYNPVFERECVVDDEVIIRNTNHNPVSSNPIYDASYVHLGVSQNLYVENELYVRGENVNTVVDNINNTYSRLDSMLTDINNRIQELDDKTSFIANMNLPSYNIAKNISYDNINIRLLQDNKDIFSDVSNINFNGKILDTTAHVHMSFKAIVKKNIPEDILRITIRLPANSIPDDNMVFKYYPVVYNLVNIKSDGTLDFFYGGQKSRVAYVDTYENNIIFRVDNQSRSLDNVSISIQTSYFVKPIVATSGRMVADVLGPIRHSTLYYKQYLYDFENKTTYAWTVFDEQVDLFINYRYTSNIDDPINENKLKTIGFELPFKSSEIPYIDKIGHSIIRYKPIQSLDEWVTYNHNFIIRKEDPNTLYMDIGSFVPIDVDATIQISYFRDISDQITNLTFLDNTGVGYDIGDRVYYKASDVFKITFITTEPINSYYLNNKLSLSNLGDFSNVNLDVTFQGMQTLWDVGIHANLDTTIPFSINNIRCEIDLFNQKYVSDNELVIINSYINVQTSYEISSKNIIHIRLYNENDIPLTLYDLPHTLYVQIRDIRYPEYFPIFNHEYSFTNIPNYMYIYDNTLYNNTYDILIYTIDRLNRYHVVSEHTLITESTSKPQIYTYELVETSEGILLQSNIFYNESNIEFEINETDPYDLFYLISDNIDISPPELSILLQTKNTLIVNNKKNPITNILIEKDILPTNGSYYISIISTPFNEHTIDRISSEILSFTPQSILSTIIQNTSYNDMDNIYYARNLKDVSFIVTKSKPFQITANLGPYSSITTGNIIQFTEDPVVTDVMQLEINLLMLPNYILDANIVISNYIHTSDTCNISFENFDYEYYRISIRFNNDDSYMKYTASIEFDSYPVANQMLSNQIDHFQNSNTFELYISQDKIPGGIINLTGNVIVEDRIGAIFKEPFRIHTVPPPQINLNYQQYGRFIHIYANIDNTHPSFLSWDGNVHWYINDIFQPNRNSIQEFYILEITDFKPLFKRTFKANVDFNSINIYGTLQRSVYGILNNQFVFDNMFYKPGDNVRLQFTILNTNQNEYSNISVQLYHKDDDQIISNEYTNSYQGNLVDVSLDIPLNSAISQVGEFYANVSFYSQNSYIGYNTTNIISVIDLTPIESIESYIQLSSEFVHSLYINNIVDDTFIEHDVYIYLFYNNVWNSFGNISVSKYSEFPIYVGELPSFYNYNSSIIKYEVYDVIHTTPKLIYIPTNFKYQAYNIHIDHYIDTNTDELFGNVSFNILSSNVHDTNMYIDYSWIPSVDTFVVDGNVIVNDITNTIHVQSQLQYNTLYTFHIRIDNYESNLGHLLPVINDTSRSFSFPTIETEQQSSISKKTTIEPNVKSNDTHVKSNDTHVKSSKNPRIIKMKKMNTSNK